MRAQVAAGADGPNIQTSPLGAFKHSHDTTGRVRSGSLAERLLRLIGRGVLGIPASTWMLVDVSLISLCTFVAFSIYPPPAPTIAPHVTLWQAMAVFAFTVIVASLVFGLYERETIMSRSRILTRLGLTVVTATIVAYAIVYVVLYTSLSRRVTVIAMSLFLIGGSGIRLGAWWAVHKVHCGLLVIGSAELYRSFKLAKTQDLLHEYRLVGYASADQELASKQHDPEYVGNISEWIGKLASRGITDIVVSDAATRDPAVMEWMVPCLQRGCRVTNEATFYEKATGQILVDQITPTWFIFADLKVHCDEQATLKRAADLIIAGLGICLSAPLWPLIALAVKLCDGGPAFYSQDRVGENGRVFKLFKFRTMRIDAENGKSIWSSPNDPRVTRVGRFLRKSRLDELPQLYNVLAGQMSVVGPRPERPDIVTDLCTKLPFYAERHLVKPGITGWAQISFRYGSSIEDSKRKLQFDLYYLKHMSFELDLMILFRTAGTFLRGGC